MTCRSGCSYERHESQGFTRIAWIIKLSNSSILGDLRVVSGDEMQEDNGDGSMEAVAHVEVVIPKQRVRVEPAAHVANRHVAARRSHFDPVARQGRDEHERLHALLANGVAIEHHALQRSM